MNETEWDVGMTDEKFVALSESIFKLQIWTLHDGICLFCKLDPVKKHPPVGSMPQDPDCSTTRIYKICLEALNHHKGTSENFYNSPALEPLYEDPQKTDATDVQVNPRVFIQWASKKWPEDNGHLELAEEQYQKRKTEKKIVWKKGGEAAPYQKEEVKKAFLKMVVENNLKPKLSNGKAAYWAREVNNILSAKIANPYKENTVRLWIRDWIDEYQ